MHKLILKRFQVKNFRNIEDSEWIPVERVTCMVGRNEAGKTALLKALYKLNPASPDPFNPQREFPRDRFAQDFKSAADWPVCVAEFELTPEFRSALKLTFGTEVPDKVICTRFYDGRLTISLETTTSDAVVAPSELAQALDQFAAGSRKVPEDEDREAELLAIGSAIATWANEKKDKLRAIQDLRSPAGIDLLKEVRSESDGHSKPYTAALIKDLQTTTEQLLTRAEVRPLHERLEEEIRLHLPVFIYFENYGILDSAVYLPHFIDDLARVPDDPRIRTIQAMFKHVGVSAQEITELGREEAAEAMQAKQNVTADMIARDQQRKELRSLRAGLVSRLQFMRKYMRITGADVQHQRRSASSRAETLATHPGRGFAGGEGPNLSDLRGECPAPGPAFNDPMDGRHPRRPGRGDRRGLRGQIHAARSFLEEAAAEKYMASTTCGWWLRGRPSVDHRRRKMGGDHHPCGSPACFPVHSTKGSAGGLDPGSDRRRSFWARLTFDPALILSSLAAPVAAPRDRLRFVDELYAGRFQRPLNCRHSEFVGSHKAGLWLESFDRRQRD